MLRPRDFDGGAACPDGSAWEVDGELYKRNPRLLLGQGEHAMLELWRACRGGMGGSGFLPEAVMNESAKMLQALRIMDEAHEEFRPKR